jgi:iron complex outermembrane receptor protein
MKTNVSAAAYKRFTGVRFFRQCGSSFSLGTRASAARGGSRAPTRKGLGIVAVPAAALGKRDWNVKNIYFSGLKAGAAPMALALALCSGQAFAQDTVSDNTVNKDQPAATGAQADTPTPTPVSTDDSAIIVTGSIVRNPAAATASPVVSVSAEDLSNRGITTVTDALQLLTANGSGTAPPSWSSFGFATGASAPSLRGLNDAYTLTLFNGLRTAPYPLGDDGYRNFVDINTIPGSIIDRVDVLLDGASATYGSDAIAGEVNVITSRQITGIHANGSVGISQRGDAGERRLSLTAGYGDLDEQGFNIYVNGEYQKSDPLLVRERGYPFNTADQSQICGTADQGCLFNGIRNGIQADGSYGGFASTRVPFVRPYDATGTAIAGRGYELLNPALGCQGLTAQTLTAAQRNGTVTPAIVCQEDLVNEYRAYNSNIERKGANLRATARIGSFGEAYLMANYYNTSTKGNFAGPQGFTGQTAAGGTTAVVSAIFLPVYVCPQGTASITPTALSANSLVATGCTAANGTLNPNNPYAAQGQMARLIGLPAQSRRTDTDTKTYRLTGGINGTIGDGWNVDLAATFSSVELNTTNNGYIYLRGLEDAIAKGTYNFVDQSQNSEEAIQGVFPTNHNHSYSRLFQTQASVNKDLFMLPGGELNVAVVGGYRFEQIVNPSANPPNDASPDNRYFGINAVGVEGKRHVWSAGYEITAPILDILKVKAEGSYDSYSTGQSRFSPKFEAELRPVEQLKLRGTYSKGFRIPSFSESFALPTTGYVSSNIVCTNAAYTAFCAAHASNPAYYSGGYNYGLTSQGNPDLKPEKATSYTLGAVVQPTRNITFTVDYWRTKITDVIIPVSGGDAVAQYYANNGVVNLPGITVVPGVADPQNPGALPLLGFVQGSYKNADQFLAKGIDFTGNVRVPLGFATWSSTANASLLLRLQQVLEDGTVQRYDASLGACNITSCSGAPKWRATWQNTLDFDGRGNISLTAYYTSGYSEVATDSGGIYGDCQGSVDAGQILGWDNGDPVQCRAKAVFNLDGHGEIKVADKFTFYVDVLNLLDTKPDYEPNAAYGLYNFNPAWSDRLFIGRYFRVGAKVDF